ncbi:MAG TPA: hypothetical protein V6D14_06785 [Coleofasciculaceae cyanobacterium]|jgi:hypothetical protein
MLTTLELRWFSHGTPLPEVEHWFSIDCPGERQGSAEEREDLYLYTPECDYLNIKLRQGSLEVKWRKTELGILQFGDRWEGKLEKWLKWICQDPTQQSILPADVIGKGPWVGVKKVRSQRQYQGVSYELTQLTIRNDVWWSIAFEMADKDTDQINHFEDVVSQVSKTYQGANLSADKSYAYPRWLSVLI